VSENAGKNWLKMAIVMRTLHDIAGYILKNIDAICG